MTCIVGLVSDNKVYIGGDSAGVSDYHYSIRKDKKVFRRGEMIFGVSGSFRMGQILRYSFDIPIHLEGVDDFTYLCTDFIDGVIDSFTKKGYCEVINGVAGGGFFLLGYRGNLYQIESDFQVAQVIKPFDACGCGEQYALGAMDIVVHDKTLTPEEKVIKALEVSESFCSGVRKPFNVVCLEQ